MLTNNIENSMLNFWNLPRRLRPKIWPKEGQNFSKFKSFDQGMNEYNEIANFGVLKKMLHSFTLCFFLT